MKAVTIKKNIAQVFKLFFKHPMQIHMNNLNILSSILSIEDSLKHCKIIK